MLGFSSSKDNLGGVDVNILTLRLNLYSKEVPGIFFISDFMENILFEIVRLVPRGLNYC